MADTEPKPVDDLTPAYVHWIEFWPNNTPEGFPRTLARWVYTEKEKREHTDTCQEERTLCEVSKLLGLHTHSISSIYPKPVPQRPRDTLARMRRNRLQKRMSKKWPLFAEQLIQEELDKIPDYYAGLSPYDDYRTNYNRTLAEEYIKDKAAIAKRKEQT